jgi:hypothetical protein
MDIALPKQSLDCFAVRYNIEPVEKFDKNFSLDIGFSLVLLSNESRYLNVER